MEKLKYDWKSVVTGGGGFVPGIICHPGKKGLVYLRTDMGGAYRRDKNSQKWLCLTDMFGKEEAEYNGVLSMAVDPQDQQTVYMMNGKYTHDKACFGAFHSSNNKGLTWKRTILPFKVGGNEMGRGCGERLSVNPRNNSEILMGSTTHGLWKSPDKGKKWARIGNFRPKNINFTSYFSSDSKDLIFAATTDIKAGLYMSEDGGISWKTIPGQPAGLMAIRADFAGSLMYITFACSQGPYGMTRGDFWRYDIDAGIWTDLKPPSGEGGFSGVSVDRQNPDRMIVSTLNRSKPHDEIYRSIDAGKTWEPVIGTSKWDMSYAGYIKTMNPHWMADIKLDPFDGSRAMFVTGYGIWTSNNIFSKQASWFFDSKGLEETVPMQLVSPNKGAHLLSAMGDIDGFKHDSFAKSPAERFSPWVGTTLSIAAAEQAPSKLVKAFNSKPPYGAYSNDQGTSWMNFRSCPRGAKKGGLRSIALSCDGKAIIWAPKGTGIFRSVNSGCTWEKCRGKMKSGLWPFADRVNPENFYLFDGVKGILYISRDKGLSFAGNSAIRGKEKEYPGEDGMAEYSAAAAPGNADDVWLAAGKAGLYHYENSRIKKIKAVSAAFRIGFGRPKKTGAYPAIYLWGAIDKIKGFFRSIDSGRTWERINDELHQYGWIHDIIGDPRIFGRCYIGVEGRGILRGEVKKN